MRRAVLLRGLLALTAALALHAPVPAQANALPQRPVKQNVAHIPCKGVAPAMNDLMGGQTDFMCDQTITALPQLSNVGTPEPALQKPRAALAGAAADPEFRKQMQAVGVDLPALKAKGEYLD